VETDLNPSEVHSKVFLSWSGERSRRVAEALRDWLPEMLHAVQPWLSSRDIVAGSSWADDLTKVLAEARAGIVCLTSDNMHGPWISFEVGALFQAALDSRVYVYALDVLPSEVSGPLVALQALVANREGTLRLVKELNQSDDGEYLPDASLQRGFDLWWPKLEAMLAAIPPAPVPVEDRQHAHPADSGADLLVQKVDRALALLESLTERQRTAIQAPAAGGMATPAKGPPERPRAFIGSSTEGLAVAQAIQELLDPVAECTIWNQGVFPPGGTFIDSLQDARLMYDFAIIVLTADDTTTSRGETAPAPRDNLLFELGLFAGALGRARTFLVLPADAPPRLPSDLSGVTPTKYRSRSDGNLVAALGPATSQITRAMGIGTR